MKRLLNFLTNTTKGQGILLGISIMTIGSLIVGLLLSIPIFWMGGKNYQETWMNAAGPYFFIPLGICLVVASTLFAPYLFFRTHQQDWKDNTEKDSTQRILRGMAIFFCLIPGGIIYGTIAKVLDIPYGLHNLLGMMLFAYIYANTISFILKKPFRTISEFLPLC